jgi:GAF domain-containing protein/HAMP domain-containing protein
MKWTVGRRLMLSFFLLAVLMVAIGAFSLYNLRQLNASTEEILREHQPSLTDMATIESSALFHSLKVDQYVTTGNRAHLRAVEDLRNRVEVSLTDLEARSHSPEDQQLVQKIREAYATYVSLSDELQTFYQLHPDDTASIEGRQMRVSALLENALLSNADAMYEAKQSQAQALIQANRELYLVYVRITVISSLVLTLLAVGLSIFISRSIILPIRQLVEATQRIAGGDLAARAQVETSDEIGTLAGTFNAMAAQLQEVIGTLEQRVAERTQGLKTAAEVARATTSVLDPDHLLRQVVDLARERFNLYYVGLFLLDEERKFAVLRAGTGEAGQQMLAQGHKLEMGGDSMVGQCVARSEARIALDVGEEAARFDNPFLPETRSEMALPLRSRGRVIGAMTVQSVREAAFDEADVAVMQTMADQVAVAIDNAQLFAQTQAALQEMEATQRRYLGQAWSKYTHSGMVSGYKYSKEYGQTQAAVVPLGDEALPEVQQAIMELRPVVGNSDGDTDQARESSSTVLVAPIVLRGQPIGALGFKHGEGDRQWTADDVALAETIAEELALALENTRLLEETQRRAAREQLLGQVTARMRESLDLETILKTAAGEMRQVLGLDRLIVRLAAKEIHNESTSH